MLSFILIGRNESRNISRCIESVLRSMADYADIPFEVLYIDSCSTDDTIEKVLAYESIRVYQITRGQSPAAGRNLGASLATYDYFFFVDGDLEIVPAYMQQLLPLLRGGKAGVFSGPHINVFPGYKQAYRIADNQFKTIPGWFVIDRKTFFEAGAFDARYKKPGGEDYDLVFRLQKRDVWVNYLPEYVAHHHTQAYIQIDRAWQMLFNGSQLYARPLLYRRHFFNRHIWPLIIRREYTLGVLLLCLILTLMGQSLWWCLAYLFIVALKSAVQRHRPWYEFFLRLPYYGLRDTMTLLGFIFFWPSQPKPPVFQRIR